MTAQAHIRQEPPSEQPSAWVSRFASVIPAGEVLDLACGGGRHARLLSALGHPVVAVDRDAAALKRAAGKAITTCQVDLETGGAWPFEAERFMGIVVTNYLHRPLFPHIVRSLASNGVLIYETFARGNEYFGKPSNPLFLLQSGELLDIIREADLMHILAYEDGYVETPKQAMVQRICAVKKSPDALPERLRLF